MQRNSTVMGLPQNAIAIVIDGVNIQDQSVKSTDGFYADIRPQTDLVEQVTVVAGARRRPTRRARARCRSSS